MLDRLRARMAEVERQHRELQRRHAEQASLFIRFCLAPLLAIVKQRIVGVERCS